VSDVLVYRNRVASARGWRVAPNLAARLGGLLWSANMLTCWRHHEELLATCEAYGHTPPADECRCGIVGNVEGLSRQQITELVAAAQPDKKKVSGDAGNLYRFAYGIRVGDVVVSPDGATRELLLGTVTGPYEFREKPVVSNFRHIRKVEWLGRRSRDELPKPVLYSLGSLLAVFRPSGRESILALLKGEEPSTDGLDDGSQDGSDEIGEDLFSDLQSRSEELIKSKVAGLDGYEMQDLVAGVLRAIGYHTRVSPPGADGGVDFVASSDPLEIKQPLVKAQVKARPTTKSNVNEIRELAGVLGPSERGIFVSSGGFAREALNDAAAARMVLVDGERLQDLLVRYYDRLDQDTRSLVPLRRLYFPTG
jgi:restriction system protein